MTSTVREHIRQERESSMTRSIAGNSPGSPDEVPQPPITSGCFRCKVTVDHLTRGYLVVSPTGKAHHGECGKTHCGIDATGPNWWWPL